MWKLHISGWERIRLFPSLNQQVPQRYESSFLNFLSRCIPKMMGQLYKCGYFVPINLDLDWQTPRDILSSAADLFPVLFVNCP